MSSRLPWANNTGASATAGAMSKDKKLWTTPNIVIVVLGVLLVAAIGVAVGLGVSAAVRTSKAKQQVGAVAPAPSAPQQDVNNLAGGLFGTPTSNALAGGLGSPESPAVIPGPPLAEQGTPDTGAAADQYLLPQGPTDTQPEPVRPVNTQPQPQPQPQPPQPQPPQPQPPQPQPQTAAARMVTIGSNLPPTSDRRKTTDPAAQPAELASAAAALLSPASGVDALASFRPGQHMQPLGPVNMPVINGTVPPSITYGAATLTAEQAVAMIQHPSQTSTLFVVSSTCGYCHKLGASLKDLITSGALSGAVVGVLPVEEVAKIADKLPPIAGVPQGFKVGMGKVTPGPKGALPSEALLAFISAS